MNANAAIGYVLQPYTRIGGKHIYPLPLMTHIQTDGSFRARKGYVAILLTTPPANMTIKQMFEIQQALGSTEMEWASIAAGLEFALENDQECIGIENDNLGVIGSLITNSTPKQAYGRHYKQKILTLAQKSVWTGVRWIPRKHNKADDLFLPLR